MPVLVPKSKASLEITTLGLSFVCRNGILIWVNPETQCNLREATWERREKPINSKNRKQEKRDRPGCAILFVPVKWTLVGMRRENYPIYILKGILNMHRQGERICRDWNAKHNLVCASPRLSPHTISKFLAPISGKLLKLRATPLLSQHFCFGEAVLFL